MTDFFFFCESSQIYGCWLGVLASGLAGLGCSGLPRLSFSQPGKLNLAFWAQARPPHKVNKNLFNEHCFNIESQVRYIEWMISLEVAVVVDFVFILRWCSVAFVLILWWFCVEVVLILCCFCIDFGAKAIILGQIRFRCENDYTRSNQVRWNLISGSASISV